MQMLTLATERRPRSTAPPRRPAPAEGAGAPGSAPDWTRVRTLMQMVTLATERESRRTAPPRRPAPSGGRDPGFCSGLDTCTDFNANDDRGNERGSRSTAPPRRPARGAGRAPRILPRIGHVHGL